MAIIKFTNSKAELKTIIDYVTRIDKTNANLITGKDCVANSCLEEMKTVKEFYNKNGGRQYIHIVQSFSPKDDLDFQKAHEIGIKFANYFQGFQVLVATHTDREHIHNHLIINAVNFENGKKFNQSKNDMQKVKDYSDRLCKGEGLEIIEKKKYQGIYNKNEYQVALKGQSWKMKLANAIDYLLEKSKNKTEFFKNMNKLGYQVLWTKNRKYITYTTPEGMKCRDNKLNDKKYLKEEMENAINGGIKEEKSNRYTRRTRDNTNTNNNEIYVTRSRYTNRNDNLENKQATEDINKIRTTLKKDKQEIQSIMNDLQEKLIENVETIVTDKMNEFIHQEEKYKEKNMAFKMKSIFIAIIIGVIAGWIITLLH